MSEAVVTITPEESAALAARLMTRHNLGVLPVCDYHGKLQGMVTDRDIITRCIAVDQDPSRVPVADIMSARWRPSHRRRKPRRPQSGWHGSRCGVCRWWKRGSWWGWCP